MNNQLKPYMLMIVKCDGYSYCGELMSFPTPQNTIMVRRVPGHPGTLDELNVSQLTKPTDKFHWVHYASVKPRLHPRLSFPIDMLRYDFAAPVNFNPEIGKIDPSHGQDDLLIATVSVRSHPRWTDGRWQSFGWEIESVKSERIKE